MIITSIDSKSDMYLAKTQMTSKVFNPQDSSLRLMSIQPIDTCIKITDSTQGGKSSGF